MFRNYNGPQQSFRDVTILDAIKAGWSSPPFLPPISLGLEGRKQEVMSATSRFINPTQETLDELNRIYDPETPVSCIFSLGSGFRGVLSLDQANMKKSLGTQVAFDPERVAEDIQARLGTLGVYYRFSVDRGLEGQHGFQGGFGDIKTHSNTYLSRSEPSTKMDDCLTTAELVGIVHVSQLSQYPL